MHNNDNNVELRILGPDGKPYVDLEDKYTQLFDELELFFMVPLLFSSPSKTSVTIAIGVGVLIGAGTHLVEKLIDEVFEIKESQPSTEITINIQNGDKYYFIEGSKDEMMEKLKAFKAD